MNNRFQIPKYFNVSYDSQVEDCFLPILYHHRILKIKNLYRKYFKNIGFFRSIVDFFLRKAHQAVNLFFRFKFSLSRRYSIIKFRDYIRANGSPVSNLVSECRAETPPPKIFPEKDSLLVRPAHPFYEFAPIQVATIQDATVIVGTNMIFVKEKIICHDLYDFKSDSTSEELHNRCSIDRKNNQITWFRKHKNRIKISTAAVFLDACAHNYAHWVTEVLPRIAAFCKQDSFNGIPIVVDDGLHINLMESLGPIVGGNREIYTLRKNESLFVEALFLVSAAGYVPFGVKSRSYSTPSQGVFSPLGLTQMRKFFMEEIEKFPKRQWPSKIFLLRKSSARNLLNENKLMLGLLERGFTPIDTNELTFLEQVQLFSNAREIVAVTGSSLVNAIFAGSGAKISVIMSKHKDMIYKYWLNMLSPLGIHLTYLLGNISSKKYLGIHSDFVISEECLLDFLSNMDNT